MSPPPDHPAAADKKAKSDAALRTIPADHLARDLEAGRLWGVYVVTTAEVEERGRFDERPGADPQSLLATARAIEQAALKGGDPSLDFVKVDYLDGDHQGTGVHALVAHEARSVSLFGGRRVITIVHADGLAFGESKGRGKKAKATPAEDPLEKLLAQAPAEPRNPPYVLVFVAEHIDRRKVAWKTVLQAGAVVEVPPLTVGTLHAYLEREGAPFQIRVEPHVAQRIWDRLGGSDAARLRQTADRLLLDAGPKGAVTVRMVEETVPMDRDAALWAITDAIADEDVLRAVTILRLMLEPVTPGEREGEVLRILGFLNNQYLLLAQIASAWARNKGEGQVAQELGIHPFRLKNLTRQLRAMKAGRLERALTTLDAADHILKSTGLGDRKVATMRWLEHLVGALAKGTPLRSRPASGVLDAL